jgi:transcription elongation factor/antiterminator RfaH
MLPMTEDIHGTASQCPPLIVTGFAPRAPRWFAVNTHPAAEHKACLHLENQGWQTFLPRIARTLRSGRRTRTELRPLFPGYVFIHLDIGHSPWRAIDSTIGVRSLVKNGDTPAAIPAGIVEALQDMTQQNGQVVFTAHLRRGDKVKFLTGPFAEMAGALERLDSKGRVLILLNLLGRETQVSAHASEIQPIRQAGL